MNDCKPYEKMQIRGNNFSHVRRVFCKCDVLILNIIRIRVQTVAFNNRIFKC